MWSFKTKQWSLLRFLQTYIINFLEWHSKQYLQNLINGKWGNSKLSKRSKMFWKCTIPTVNGPPICNFFNPLSPNPTKWSHSNNCLNVFDHFVWLALKGLIQISIQFSREPLNYTVPIINSYTTIRSTYALQVLL